MHVACAQRDLSCGVLVIASGFPTSYCPISINSAGPVTRYTPAEILVSALFPYIRYIACYIAQKIQQVIAGGPKIWGMQ